MLSLLSSCEFVIRRRSSFYFFCVECPKGHPYYIGDVSILWGTSKRALHGVADDIRNLVTSFLMTIRKTFMYISFAFSCKVVTNFSNCSWDWRGLHLNQIYTFSLHFCWLNFLVEFFRWFVFFISSTRRNNLLAPETLHFYYLDIHSKTAETGFFPEDFFFGELPSWGTSLYTSVVGSVQTNLMFFCSILSFFFHTFIVVIFLCSVVVLWKWKFVLNAKSKLVALDTIFQQETELLRGMPLSPVSTRAYVHYQSRTGGTYPCWTCFKVRWVGFDTEAQKTQTISYKSRTTEDVRSTK